MTKRDTASGQDKHIRTPAPYLRTSGCSGVRIHNVVMYTLNYDCEGECLPYDANRVLKPVHIGRNLWIGMNIVITLGVTIGEGAIIGMGPAMAKDVPPLAIVGSAPQRILKMRDESHYRALDAAEL